jgi:hypothetical protein
MVQIQSLAQLQQQAAVRAVGGGSTALPVVLVAVALLVALVILQAHHHHKVIMVDQLQQTALPVGVVQVPLVQIQPPMRDQMVVLEQHPQLRDLP